MIHRRFYGLVGLAVVFVLAVAQPHLMSQSIGQRPLITGMRGIVTSNHPLATAAGMRVLLKGGNAFDAAVAAAAATSVVDPLNSSLGGNGFATIYVAKTRQVRALNFFGTAPAAASPELFKKESLNEGILASPVPSNLRGYDALLKQYGTMSLAQVFEPAIELADQGFVVTADFATLITRFQDTFKKYPTSAAVFLPGGQPPAVGFVFVQRDYARTLRQVAQRGAEDFYSGDLAKRIATFYQQQGGILSSDDLRKYQAAWVEPISVTYHGYTVYTQPPNSSAIALLEALNMVEGLDLKALGHNSAPYLHRFMEVVRLALADRNRFVADGIPVPIAGLLSKDYARKQRERIDPEKALLEVTPGDLKSEVSGDTTHITVADHAGNMVALTQTLGGPYGSFVVVGDTGLLFSNQMRHMHLDPESPSKIRGGVRPRSNQSPTIILKDGEAVLALGSPGGDPIWQRLPQIIANIIDFGMDIQRAIDAPRFSYAGPQETGTSIKPIWAVEDKIPADVIARLKSMGHEIKLVASEAGFLGGTNGIMRDPKTGALTGGADPRGKSYGIGY